MPDLMIYSIRQTLINAIIFTRNTSLLNPCVCENDMTQSFSVVLLDRSFKSTFFWWCNGLPLSRAHFTTSYSRWWVQFLINIVLEWRTGNAGKQFVTFYSLNKWLVSFHCFCLCVCWFLFVCMFIDILLFSNDVHNKSNTSMWNWWVCQINTHAPLFRGGADYVYQSPLGDSSLVMHIHNLFMHSATSQYAFKPRDVKMLMRAVTIVAG